MMPIKKKEVCPKCSAMMEGMLCLMEEMLETLDEIEKDVLHDIILEDYWKLFDEYKKKFENMHK